MSLILCRDILDVLVNAYTDASRIPALQHIQTDIINFIRIVVKFYMDRIQTDMLLRKVMEAKEKNKEKSLQQRDVQGVCVNVCLGVKG
jgi:hypothetical protein